MATVTQYLDTLQADGRFVFTTKAAAQTTGRSHSATRAALWRLKKKGHIADPYRGFHVIVPPAYRRLGCLPAEQFIPDLMAHLGLPYYVALLSAAMYHGAAHHAPMVFQVIVPKARHGLECGGGYSEDIDLVQIKSAPIGETLTLLRAALDPWLGEPK